MWSYFKSLRRKFGVVTLVIACVLAAGWVRSFYIFDVYTQSQETVFASDKGGFGAYTPTSVKVTANGTTAFLRELKQRWSVPYWSVVVPLTLLTTWLLLSKPRARQPKPHL